MWVCELTDTCARRGPRIPNFLPPPSSTQPCQHTNALTTSWRASTGRGGRTWLRGPRRGLGGCVATKDMQGASSASSASSASFAVVCHTGKAAKGVPKTGASAKCTTKTGKAAKGMSKAQQLGVSAFRGVRKASSSKKPKAQRPTQWGNALQVRNDAE
jgi:hypothetical protein